MELVRACTSVAAENQKFESSTLIFLGGCALAVLGGCAFHLERFVAHWDSFQTFVSALLS